MRPVSRNSGNNFELCATGRPCKSWRRSMLSSAWFRFARPEELRRLAPARLSRLSSLALCVIFNPLLNAAKRLATTSYVRQFDRADSHEARGQTGIRTFPGQGNDL